MELRNCLSLVFELAEVYRFLLFLDILRDTILNKSELQRSAGPLLAEQILERKGDVLWLTFVEESHQSLELLRIKSILKNMVGDIAILDFAKALKDFTPIQIRVQLSEGPCKILNTPGHRGLLVLWFLFNGRWVSILIRLKGVVDDLGNMIILALMMDGQLQDGLCHHLLIDAFELRQRLEQEVVHVGAVVADIDQNFPRLEDLAHELEVLETEAIFQDVVRGKLEMGIDLGDILVERRPQRRELAVPVCIGLNYELLWLSQLRILCKLRNTIE